MAKPPTGSRIGPHRRPRRAKDLEPASRPFTFEAQGDRLSDEAWREAIGLLQSLTSQVAHMSAAGHKPKAIVIFIDQAMTGRWEQVEEILAILNFRFGWSVTARTFPELALMRVVAPAQLAWNRKRDWAKALKEVRGRGKKSPQEALRGGVYAATRVRDPKPRPAKAKRPLRS